NSVTAYPNPTSAVLNISIDQQVAKAVVIEVMDITGRQVGSIINLPAEVHLNAQIGMSDFKPGSYIVLLNPGTADAYTIKVIKQ
ncbi:MAG: T9SS type A sorting domain-containing protein, partial [Flavipsychrobacter sp.]